MKTEVVLKSFFFHLAALVRVGFNENRSCIEIFILLLVKVIKKSLMKTEVVLKLLKKYVANKDEYV